MASYRSIYNITRDEVFLPRATWCSGYWCKLRGLMFRSSLPTEEGLLFVHGRESRVDTSIHMLFMFFSISVIWLAADLTVVDAKLAKPWRLAYLPQKPAQYYIEGVPALLEQVAVGDQLRFDQGA